MWMLFSSSVQECEKGARDNVYLGTKQLNLFHVFSHTFMNVSIYEFW